MTIKVRITHTTPPTSNVKKTAIPGVDVERYGDTLSQLNVVE